MRHLVIYLLSLLGVVTGISVFAQQSLEGNWELVSADINLLRNGTSELIQTLTADEIKEKSIPTTLELTTHSLMIVNSKGKFQSAYTSETGQMVQKLSDVECKKTYMSWLLNDNTLVLTTEYDGEDFKGNELKLTFNKK